MILAIGGGLAIYNQHFYSDQITPQFAPELVAYAYFPIKYNLSARVGARLNYAWDQTHNTQALGISQTDFRYYAEGALVYNWILIPSVAVGVGANYQTANLATKPPIYVSQDNISYAQNLASMYVQAGVGFPLLDGKLVIEPYARYTVVQTPGDNSWGYGIEATVQIF